MKTGIVILNYNDSETTVELLKRIENFEILDLIVVVDNCSKDNSIEVLKKYENEKIKVIKTDENKGYSYGNNIGCKYLVENNIDYIIISNPDVIFKEDDIFKLCKCFEDDNIGIVAPVVNEHGKLNRGWKFQSVFIDSMSNINLIGRKFKKMLLYEDKYYETEISEVDVVSGCFFVARADDLQQIDYFDENVFLYYEESILAKKIKNINKKIIVNNKVKIIHNHSVTINKSFNKIKKFKILAKSQRYYHKTYNKAGLLKMLMLYVSYYITLGISYVLRMFRR